jgi:hypothetical protein
MRLASWSPAAFGSRLAMAGNKPICRFPGHRIITGLLILELLTRGLGSLLLKSLIPTCVEKWSLLTRSNNPFPAEWLQKQRRSGEGVPKPHVVHGARELLFFRFLQESGEPDPLNRIQPGASSSLAPAPQFTAFEYALQHCPASIPHLDSEALQTSFLFSSVCP